MRYTSSRKELSAVCLPQQDGEIPRSVFPNGTTSKLAGLFSTLYLKCRASSREAVPNFKDFDWTQLKIKPTFTAPEAGALTTRPSELLNITPNFSARLIMRGGGCGESGVRLISLYLCKSTPGYTLVRSRSFT